MLERQRWLPKQPDCRAVFGKCTTCSIGNKKPGARPLMFANCLNLMRERSDSISISSKKTWTANRPEPGSKPIASAASHLGYRLLPLCSLIISRWNRKTRTRKAFAPRSTLRWRKNRRHDRIAISHDHLHRCRDRFAGWSGRFNIFNRAGANGRDARLWWIAGLFQSPRQCVRQSSRNSGRLLWSACLFQCVRLRYVRAVRLRARAHISHSNHWRDVSRHALAALRSGLPAARLLPLLPVFCGNHVSACGAGDCSAARTRQIRLLSGLLSCLAKALAPAHALWSPYWSTSAIYE